MRKIMMICIWMGASMMYVNAQEESKRNISPEKQAERLTERMAENLGLDESQKNEIYNFHLEQAQSRKEALEKRRKAMAANRKAHQEKMAGILTPEQLEKWNSEKKETREKVQNRRRSPGKRNMDGVKHRRPRSGK